MKREVYFNEYNVLMDTTVYLPLVSGLLLVHAQKNPRISEIYRFMPFIYARNTQTNILSQYDNPAIAAFAVSMWNVNLSLSVAKELKKKFPQCVIVFGGPSVPCETDSFLEEYPFVDVIIRGEGEQTFAEILLRLIDSNDLSQIPGISYRDFQSGACIRNMGERDLPEDLDGFLSPYIEGVYDYLFCTTEIKFQAIIETNRGCPYTCAFCFWGKERFKKKMRFYSIERIKAIAEWCGEKSISYVFCADSNFGLFKRDYDIAKIFVDAKKRYGFPDKFRTSYAKNTEDTVYQIARLFIRNGMDKGICMSRQTNSLVVAENIRRKNINMEVYNNLSQLFTKDNISVYTELIIGLPGETCKSFSDGLENLLQAGVQNQIYMYSCNLLQNTALAESEYRRQFAIESISIPFKVLHTRGESSDIVQEYEDIVVSTSSMSRDDWRQITAVAWITMLFHGLQLCLFILIYLAKRCNVRYIDFIEYVALRQMKAHQAPIVNAVVDHLYEVLDSILDGTSRGQGEIVKEYGDIYWYQEEVSYLAIISAGKDEFFAELHNVVRSFLVEREIAYDEEELREVVEYQRIRVPNIHGAPVQEHAFTYNFPEYFADCLRGQFTELCHKPQVMISEGKDYQGNSKMFAMENILFGRRNGRMLCNTKWSDIDSIKE